MTDHHNAEHHATLAGNMLDELVRMVGQDRADRAVAFATDIKEHIGHAIVAAGLAIEGPEGEDQAEVTVAPVPVEVIESDPVTDEPEFSTLDGEVQVDPASEITTSDGDVPTEGALY